MLMPMLTKTFNTECDADANAEQNFNTECDADINADQKL